MTSRTILTVLLPVAALAALACSKTEDTAPERRVFGDPPTIQSVETENFFQPDKKISCDFAQVIVKIICGLGGPDNTEPQAGDGWTYNPTNPNGDRAAEPSQMPGVFIEGTYGEATFKVRATDPNSPPKPAPSDILLVSASFVVPDSKTETSLVIFDDGSFSQFKNPQFLATPGEDCVSNPNGTCECRLGVYAVTSGDATGNDDTFTRKIALHEPNAESLLLDCIMRDAHETLIQAPPDTRFEFKIEAVDREGNLDTWNQKLVAVTSPQSSSFDCNGDTCGCCILHYGAVDPACYGLPGMIGPPGSGFEMGICAFFGP